MFKVYLDRLAAARWSTWQLYSHGKLKMIPHHHVIMKLDTICSHRFKAPSVQWNFFGYQWKFSKPYFNVCPLTCRLSTLLREASELKRINAPKHSRAWKRNSVVFFLVVIFHTYCAEEPCLLITVLSSERFLGASTQRKSKPTKEVIL